MNHMETLEEAGAESCVQVAVHGADPSVNCEDGCLCPAKSDLSSPPWPFAAQLPTSPGGKQSSLTCPGLPPSSLGASAQLE